MKQKKTNPASDHLSMENTLDELLEGFQLIGYNWKYLYVNNALVRQSRYQSKEDLLGYTMMERYPGIENTELFKTLQHCMSQRVSSTFKNAFTFPDKSTGWFELRIHPVPKGLFILSIDITKRKKAEEELALKNAELSKINSELDRFVYSVAHDLRSPLTSILGLTSFIMNESKEPQTVAHAQMVCNRIKRLDNFIKNVLSYSKNKRTEIKIEQIHLQQTISEIIEWCNSDNGSAVNIELDINESVPFRTDPTRFSMVIENLVSNAIKYQDSGKEEKSVKIKGATDEKQLAISIEDNGIGIPAEHQGKIFDMFYRVSHKSPGSGLGLYIVKEVVEKLNGNIKLSSRPSVGTTFYLEIENKAL